MNGPRHANSCLIAYANSEGSGEVWDLSAPMSQIPNWVAEHAHSKLDITEGSRTHFRSKSSLERDGLRQAEFCPCYIMDNRPNFGFLVHKDMGSAVLGCWPVSSRLISIRLRTTPFNVTIHLDMMTMKLTTFIGNSRKSLTKHLRRTFWLYKGIGMLKLEGMHRQTEETYVDPTAMLRQMRDVSHF